VAIDEAETYLLLDDVLALRAAASWLRAAAGGEARGRRGVSAALAPRKQPMRVALVDATWCADCYASGLARTDTSALRPRGAFAPLWLLPAVHRAWPQLAALRLACTMWFSAETAAFAALSAFSGLTHLELSPATPEGGADLGAAVGALRGGAAQLRRLALLRCALWAPAAACRFPRAACRAA
jgi:hypothetical protein